MKNNRTNRFSIRLKVLLGTVLTNLLICVAMGITTYIYVRSSYVNSSAKNTLAIVKVAANQLNGNLMSILEEGADDSYANTVMLTDMQHVADSANVNAVYTLAKRNDKLVYLSTLTEEKIAIGTVASSKASSLYASAISDNGTANKKIEVTSKGVHYITAYAPILDSSGEIVGVLGVDYIVDDLMASLNGIVRIIILIGVVLVLVSAVISIWMSGNITKGLLVVDEKINDLVSNNGDLTREIELRGNDEVTDIADSINKLLDYIRSVVSSISVSSKELSSSVDTALSLILKTDEQLGSVSDNMNQMSAAMEETSSSILEIQGNTKQIKDGIQEMDANVKTGNEFAIDMERRALEVRENAEKETKKVKETAEKITESLNVKIERSKDVERISALTQTILDIASQTNLLSLNASIEAARAGEYGKGFAIVAQEISSLADNSAETAKQIQQISDEVIGNVRELAEESTKMVDFVQDKTIVGYTQLMDLGSQYGEDAKNISDMLTNVDNASGNIESSIKAVSEAINGVSIAAEESVKGISQVVDLVSEMSEHMQGNKEAANTNASISSRLDAEVNKFTF